MKAYVHRDIRARQYSVTVRGKVVDKGEWAYVKNAEFLVRPGGRARVLREQRKNVHAFVVGDVFTAVDDIPVFKPRKVVEVRYDPYKAAHFLNVKTGKPIKNAKEVWLTPLGVFAKV